MADFQIAAVFSDNMVLQRNKNISIFGYGAIGDRVKCKLYDSNGNILAENTQTITSDKWIVQLAPQTARENCRLEVFNEQKGQSKIFSNVAIGEVWLAGGQSNMEFELQNCTEGPDELKNKEAGRKIRFYYTNKIAWMDDDFYKAEKNTCWQTWDSEWNKAWSAVGYFFGKNLAKDLDCTVGIIGCNWGGTSASAWMRKEYLESDSELNTYLTEQEEATKGKSIQQQCDEYDAYTKDNDVWQQKCNHLYATVPGITWDEVQKRIGQCKWPGPKSCKNPYRPTGLYDCMLNRILPYTLKGVLWYQGESDDHKPAMYTKLFTRLIDNWRTDWNDNELPFIFVQLPEHRYIQDKDFKHWCFIREAQQKVSETVKNTWMTVALDLGQYNDIHPKAKAVLGKRMEQIAMNKIYIKDSTLSPIDKTCLNKFISDDFTLSPVVQSSFICDGRITVTFRNADSGFEIHEDKKELEELKAMEANQGVKLPLDFTGFEIAGADGVYYPAEFKFGGKNNLNQIILSSKKVPEPRFARYAWYNYGPVTIFNKGGLPAAPFRTSTKDAQAATEHAEIQQIMTV